MKGPTSVRKDPACGTCRKKSRKCDRTRPVCQRCTEKGLHCEGYPPKFKFWDYNGAAPGMRAPSAPSNQSDPSDPLDSSSSLQKSHEESNVRSPGSTDSSKWWSVPSPLTQSTPDAGRESSPVDSILPGNEWLLSHIDDVVVNELAIAVDGMENPFRQHIIPLARRNGGVLHALLGLSACHVCTSQRITGRPMTALALQHRVAALHDLGCMLLRESSRGLNECEEEAVLAIVLLLVLHDVCEHGVSLHGAHLDGVAFLCARKVQTVDMSHPSKASTLFFIATLSWLDVLRGFSGAEKLAYPPEVRACVHDNWSFGLYMTFGCPSSIFRCIGTVLEAAKAELAGTLTTDNFNAVLSDAEAYLRSWDPNSAVFPNNSPDWSHLATAFRHACLLRILRWPDPYRVPCDDPRIRESVGAILDACANIPKTSPCYKRMLFPLFMAGVDTNSEHQRHYVQLAVEEIKTCTGFPHYGMTGLMEKVWAERKVNPKGHANVPWMDFTCVVPSEGSQHAYLFF